MCGGSDAPAVPDHDDRAGQISAWAEELKRTAGRIPKGALGRVRWLMQLPFVALQKAFWGNAEMCRSFRLVLCQQKGIWHQCHTRLQLHVPVLPECCSRAYESWPVGK